MERMTPNTALQKACAAAGGQAALARALGVAAPTVNQWVKGLRPIPIHHCSVIEELTQGAISRKQLRPDDWHRIWPELQGPTTEGTEG